VKRGYIYISIEVLHTVAFIGMTQSLSLFSFFSLLEGGNMYVVVVVDGRIVRREICLVENLSFSLSLLSLPSNGIRA
jgi:hypothetical protein